MRPGVAEIIWNRRSARKAGVEKHNTVHFWLAAIAGRERCPTEQAAAHIVRVDVQVVGSPLAQGVLQIPFSLAAVSCGVPRRVGGTSGGNEIETPAPLCVGCVENVYLTG